MGKRKELSQAEIWDDSALVRSWDEALEEYKLYHNIHARGENVADILGDAESQDSTMDNGLPQSNGSALPINGLDQNVLEDGEVDDHEQEPSTTRTERSEKGPVQSSTQSGEQHQALGTSNSGDPLRALEMPHAVIGGVQDEALKNLMMSWYYAGYYTGLYEGQQQAKQPGPSETGVKPAGRG